ncbi:MAG: hypothetical protein ABSG99_06485 [Sedimentisphaerales bacterium]
MIPYDELIKITNEHQPDEAYELVSPNEDPWCNLDSIIDFVRRWNKRVPIGKNKNKIKAVALNLREEFNAFKNCFIEDFDFTQKNAELIKAIFDTLSETVLKFTGTTKLMHGINPNLFVMWDKGICIHYGVYPNSAGYIIFMKLMQEEIRGLLKKYSKKEIIKNTNRTLPKLIDEYNWKNFRTSKSVSKNSLLI